MYKSYRLNFKKPSRTSREILTQKETFLLVFNDVIHKDSKFIGEAALFRGLSADDVPGYEEKLKSVCENFDFQNLDWWEDLREFPSIQFGLEQVIKAKKTYQDKKFSDEFNPLLFESEFTEGKKGIPINGLIWMGNPDFMKVQIKEKLAQNFRCIKLKIGVNWEEEKLILKNLRNEFSENDLELRVDANGAFNFYQAQIVLQELADLKIHSIEQPIKAGQIQEMAELCQTTPTPIALDEELIGIFQKNDKQKLIEIIQPQYIILKPSLVGGWRGSEEWIEIAENFNVGWWITSALESNIGLNAIAQWTFTLNNPLPQGLGTGGLFTNNFNSRLKVVGDQLFFL
ncbi:MAG: o-succinylbenzoate synthase [Weeksellaceae bacterium]|nr:o-succinylbenzoate synthase [Weeksellaceae bacterium]